MQAIHTHQTLKEKQRMEREKLILQAAADAFQDKGYNETSMDEIAARVGVAKGTVYLHFPCKEDLVIAIFTHDMQQLLDNIDTIIQAESTAKGKITALLRSMYTGLYTKQTHLIASLYNGTNLQRLFAEKSSQLHELWQKLIIQISALLEEGKQNGEFDKAIETSVMVAALFNIFSPKGLNKPIIGEKMALEEVIRQLEHIYFKGIAAD